MNTKNTNIESFYDKSFFFSNVFLFESKRAKSLFSLMYILNQVSQGKKILYVSEFDVITDLEHLYSEYDICKELSNKIKKEKMFDSIVITSQLSSIEKILDTNFKHHFDKIIFDEVSMGPELDSKVSKKIVSSRLTLDIMRLEEPLRDCDTCTLSATGKCNSYKELDFMDSCTRIGYSENDPRFFFQRKSKCFNIERSVKRSSGVAKNSYQLTIN